MDRATYSRSAAHAIAVSGEEASEFRDAVWASELDFDRLAPKWQARVLAVATREERE